MTDDSHLGIEPLLLLLLLLCGLLCRHAGMLLTHVVALSALCVLHLVATTPGLLLGQVGGVELILVRLRRKDVGHFRISRLKQKLFSIYISDSTAG